MTTKVIPAVLDFSALASGNLIKSQGGVLTAATAGTDYLQSPSGTAILRAGNGGALQATVAGTDYTTPQGTENISNKTLNGNNREVSYISATAATGTVNVDCSTYQIYYYTTAAGANWTFNFRGNAGTTLNTAMATNDVMTVAFMVTNGGTAYYANTFQVDGTATGVTVKWQGGSAPTSGNASSIDAYTFSIMKTAASTYTIFASQVKFA